METKKVITRDIGTDKINNFDDAWKKNGRKILKKLLIIEKVNTNNMLKLNNLYFRKKLFNNSIKMKINAVIGINKNILLFWRKIDKFISEIRSNIR